MSVVISRLDPQGFHDWQALLDLILDAFASMEGRIDPPSSAHRLTPESLKEKATLETGILATGNGGLIGCIFCKAEPDSLYIGKLAISPSAQGQGVGRALLDAATAHARALGLSALRLETRIELTENHAIFGRWGFVRTAERAHAGYDRPTCIEMRKAL
ncbi:GNAT family N-acetyltransferase [Rhizobiaceae bacterium BDR2-2]|uniref:GNAT family N-acetyltransferase n=1 Tax=Ectorhizobium quercum TaxID=2965071 RepID=A0AAE3MWK7_9HYPH|nr:GNAT family N-acetyltransferase [Ectorhizobium quercum]MCX8995626.1 GNAT family N-acetyltransferase [Ectorhizobium quercum]